MKIVVKTDVPEPLYIQIYDSIVSSIAVGELKAGDALPSSRKLAADLRINYITVNKAYSLLESEGFVVTEKKKVVVLDPTDDSRREFLKRWKSTETVMLREAKAKKISKSEIEEMFKDFVSSL